MVEKNNHWHIFDQQNITWVADTYRDVPEIAALAENILRKGEELFRAEEKTAQRGENKKQREQEEEERILQSMM